MPLPKNKEPVNKLPSPSITKPEPTIGTSCITVTVSTLLFHIKIFY